MGSDHRLFAWLAKWHATRDTPLRAMLVQSLIVLALVVGFGRQAQGFERLTIFTAPVFWIMFLLVGVSLFVLRWRRPEPMRAPTVCPGIRSRRWCSVFRVCSWSMPAYRGPVRTVRTRPFGRSASW